MARCILFRSEVLQHIYLTQRMKHSSDAQKMRQRSVSFLTQVSLFFLPRAPMYSGCARTVFGPPSELNNLVIIIDQIPNR